MEYKRKNGKNGAPKAERLSGRRFLYEEKGLSMDSAPSPYFYPIYRRARATLPRMGQSSTTVKEKPGISRAFSFK